MILPNILGKVIAYSRHLFSQIDSSSIPIRYQKTVQKALQGIIEDDTNYVENIKKNNSPYSDLYLIPEAPYFLVKSVYKTLAFKYHPDRGGDSEQFQKVREAYEVITKASS